MDESPYSGDQSKKADARRDGPMPVPQRSDASFFEKLAIKPNEKNGGKQFLAQEKLLTGIWPGERGSLMR